MQPKFNLWLEEDDEVVFSTWRASLLEAVRDSGSISAAAAQDYLDKFSRFNAAVEKVVEAKYREAFS
jgi:molybdenum-dependent DNA-binding transcriptional regulator ModE